MPFAPLYKLDRSPNLHIVQSFAYIIFIARSLCVHIVLTLSRLISFAISHFFFNFLGEVCARIYSVRSPANMRSLILRKNMKICSIRSCISCLSVWKCERVYRCMKSEYKFDIYEIWLKCFFYVRYKIQILCVFIFSISKYWVWILHVIKMKLFILIQHKNPYIFPKKLSLLYFSLF